MTVEKLKAAHIEQLRALGVLKYLTEWLTSEKLLLLEQEKYAFTVLDGDTVMATGGVLEVWPNRGEAWMFFHPSCRNNFLSIHHSVKRCLDIVPYRRIEATVDVNFPAGHRWIKLLGFELEAPRMKSYTMDGRDMALYSRIGGG